MYFLKHMALSVFVLVVECSDNVVQLLGVSNGVVFQVPVVDDECQVVPDLDLLCHLVTVSEGVSHNGDQHVQQMNKHDELSRYEDNVEE